MTHSISSMQAQVILRCENPNPTKLMVSQIINQADDNINIIKALVPMLKGAIEEYEVKEIDYDSYDNDYDFCKETLEQLEEDYIDTLIFINYIKPGEFNTIYPVQIEDLKPEGLTEKEILAEFDEWAKNIREQIIKRYKEGKLPTGNDIQFAPNGFDYETEYKNRKPTEEEKKYLNRTHHDNTYYAEI